MTIKFVETMDEVLQLALERPLPAPTLEPVPEVAPDFNAGVPPQQDSELTN